MTAAEASTGSKGESDDTHTSRPTQRLGHLMSVDATTWGWQQTTSSSGQRLVLIALCDHMSQHDGDPPGRLRAWPRVARLSAMTGIGGSTVRLHLDALAQAGVITKDERRRRRDGSLGTWEYTIDTSADPSAVDAPTPSADPSAVDHSRPIGAQEPKVQNPKRPNGRASRVRSERDLQRDIGRDLAVTMADCIEATGAKRPTVTAIWVDDMDRLVRLDGRAPDDVARVVRWLYTSQHEVATFWAPNVRSPRKLRDKWDQIAAQVARSRRTGAGGGSSVERVRAATERSQQR